MQWFLQVYKPKKHKKSRSKHATSWCRRSWGLGQYSRSGLVLVDPKQRQSFSLFKHDNDLSFAVFSDMFKLMSEKIVEQTVIVEKGLNFIILSKCTNTK